jgi:hypothetical protein
MGYTRRLIGSSAARGETGAANCSDMAMARVAQAKREILRHRGVMEGWRRHRQVCGVSVGVDFSCTARFPFLLVPLVPLSYENILFPSNQLFIVHILAQAPDDLPVPKCPSDHPARGVGGTTIKRVVAPR